MDLEALTYGAWGTIAGFLTGSCAEHPIHRYILHNPTSSIPFIKTASRSHHEEHHPRYSPQTHYFEDRTNADAVTHFSKGDVGIIMGSAVAIGGVLSQLPSVIQGRMHIGQNECAFTVGFTVGAGIYYTLYETTHHAMHVLGARTAHLYSALGDALQGNQPDGKLRLSLPLMEDLVIAIRKRQYAPELLFRLTQQLEENRNKPSPERPHLPLAHQELIPALENVAQAYAETRKEESYWGRCKEWMEMQLRTSPTFQAMQRHHYVHHITDRNNLNVVLPLPDMIAGTKVASTREQLDKKVSLWHLPNPLPENRLAQTP